MKQMNNTCVEVLPALLDKSKTTTMRRAWQFNKDANIGMLPNGNVAVGLGRLEEKPPKYEVGDIVEMVWDRDSKFEWFCKICGLNTSPLTEEQYKDEICSGIGHGYNPFNKHLGKVRITSRVKVMMWKRQGIYFVKVNYKGKREYDSTHGIQSKIAKTEGFRGRHPVEDMFKYFHENDDLSTPREYWLYGKGWLK